MSMPLPRGTRGGTRRRAARSRRSPSGHRRPAVLLALLWLVVAVVSHHSLPGTTPRMASAMSHPSAVGQAAAQPMAAAPRLDHTDPGPDHAHPGHHPRISDAQSEHADHGGAHCSSYDVRSEQFVPPPPLLGHARAPQCATGTPPGPHQTSGLSPPDPTSLSVLRI
ncbi:hypothetical protein [Streptomyces sp. WZ-12]|uniref:hypothetical protein n=1 Tax=Streptomyces sp. WZ-12 TaxID=3030210 RepID=UPI00238158F8|nr:hypothetical protein [Streptomyces sp. WZ-12]